MHEYNNPNIYCLLFICMHFLAEKLQHFCIQLQLDNKIDEA